MKIIILGGFLGSGKTTMLLRLAPHLAMGSKKDPAVVVLENEISVTDVDSKLLKSQNLTVQNMAAGCVCCTSSAELPISVSAIEKQYDPDYLIIEATGMAYPDAIAEKLKKELGLDSTIIALADASRWKKLSIAMPGFVHGQLNRAAMVLLNKVDLVAQHTVSALQEQIKNQTTAPVFPVCANRPLPQEIFRLLHK